MSDTYEGQFDNESIVYVASQTSDQYNNGKFL